MGKAKTTSTSASEIKVATVPRGRPKSGRVWKSQKQRTSTVKKHKRDSFEKKQALRQHKKDIKEKSRSIVEDKKLQHQLKRDREAENKKRKEENAKKSEIVQVIRNTAKLKRIKKKQLRSIETRDTTVVEKASN